MSAVMAGAWEGRLAIVRVAPKGSASSQGTATSEQSILGHRVFTIQVGSRTDTFMRFLCGRYRYEAQVLIGRGATTNERQTRAMVKSILRQPATCDTGVS